MHRALAALLLLAPLARAQPSYGYYGWSDNGCPASPPSDSWFNQLEALSPSQWWTVTFTDNENPLGGMINFVRLAGGLASAIQITLTSAVGPGSATLVLDNQVHVGGFSSTGDGSFCIGSSDPSPASPGGCMQQDTTTETILAYGGGTTKENVTYAYELTLTRLWSDTWCMELNATTAVGFSWPQQISWLHFAPAATVSGTLTINGEVFNLAGVGQQDHVHGVFVPGVTAFKHWMDAHFTNATSGFNMYWGAMGGSPFSFARVELPEGSFTFNASDVTHSEVYDANNRPTQYSVKGTSAEGPSFAVTYSPIVPNLSYGSSPIEDIVQLSGSVCWNEQCTAVTARGWGQLIGGQFPTA